MSALLVEEQYLSLKRQHRLGFNQDTPQADILVTGA